ncbi:MAG TPA: MFS transporter [Terriglobia bacterium]|nr:MFS transporter [Terriglobia bacterium]
MENTDTTQQTGPSLFYGWWIVFSGFLNLFFAVGIVFYGFPVFYPSLVDSLGLARGQVTEGIFLGFLMVAPFAVFLGALIDRLGPRSVIRIGVFLVSVALFFMGWMSTLWQYYALCLVEVVGYILAGPISNQVLIANWFRAKRGRAMGYAYLGLGVGGAVSPVLVHFLVDRFGWRGAFEFIGVMIFAVLFPVAQLVTRSYPAEVGLQPDGLTSGAAPSGESSDQRQIFRDALRTKNFWLILAGTTLVIGAIGTVIQQFVLFLRDQGYSISQASWVSSGLLFSGLAGRVIVGCLADRYRKKNVMALFYLLMAASIPLLFLAHIPAAVWTFSIIFGFAMGADYMLIPLVTAECFGLQALGKLLAIIIMADSLGQWLGPVMAGRIFDQTHSYNWAWSIVTLAGLVGAALIFLISQKKIEG